MMNIFAHYWGWLLLITVIGFVGGMIVHPDEEDSGLPIWFWPLTGLLVLGVAASQFGFVGAPYSAWIEFAAMAFAGFTVGALAGGFGKKFGLSWGPLLVSALVGAIAMFMTPVSGWMVAEKAAPAAAEAPAASGAAADAAKSAEAKSAEAKPAEAATAAEAAAAAKAEEDAKAAAAAKADEDAKAAAAAKAEEDAKAAAKAEEDAKAAAAAKAEEDAKAAAKAEEDAKAAAAAAKAEEDAKAAAVAPLSVAALAEHKSSAIAAAKALPSKGPLDGAQCQTALSGLTAKEDIKFDSSSAKVSKQSLALIHKIGAILGRCPTGLSLEVAGYTDSSGDAEKNKTLSQNRAEAVLKLLKAKAAKGDQLTAVGYGAEKPLASNDTAEGKAANRRIEFSVK